MVSFMFLGVQKSQNQQIGLKEEATSPSVPVLTTLCLKTGSKWKLPLVMEAKTVLTVEYKSQSCSLTDEVVSVL